MNTKLCFKICTAVALPLFVLFISFIFLRSETITSGELTLGCIEKQGVIIRKYYETNHVLPRNLELDPQLLNDGWGRPLIYMITGSNTYIIKSLGPDGVLGKNNIAYLFNASDAFAPAGTLIQGALH